jgi:hypothetical protein
MGRFRSTNEGTGTTSASLAPHTVDYLFLGIDAIICSPLINDLFVHPSLPCLLIERPFHRLFFGPFVPRWDHYLFGANENVLPSNEDNVWDIIIINRSIWTTKESMD